MIEYIKGELVEATPAWVVVDCHGLGYGINVSLNTFSAVQGKKEVKLYIYEAIREDAYVLYGFATRQERELFLLLISVSGYWRKYGTYDFVGTFSLGTVQCHRQWERQVAEDCERYRTEDRTAHHCGIEG